MVPILQAHKSHIGTGPDPGGRGRASPLSLSETGHQTSDQ